MEQETKSLHLKRIIELGEQINIELTAHVKETAKYGGTRAYHVGGMQTQFEKWLLQFMLTFKSY